MTTIHTIGKSPSIEDKISRKLKPFTFPLAIRKSEQKIIANVRKYGFHIVAVHEDEENDCPEFFYTIGLYYQYKHPELLLMGLDVNAAYDIFHRAHAIIKRGGSIPPWSDLPRDMTYSPMRSVPIEASHYPTYLGFGKWFYKSLGSSRPDPFPALQFVWPDVLNEIYPWEDGYDIGFFCAQKLLCSDQALKQSLANKA